MSRIYIGHDLITKWMIQGLTFARQHEVFKEYVLRDNLTRTLKITKTNILIGANNVGKSRFLRQLLLELGNNPGLANDAIALFGPHDFEKAGVKIIAVEKRQIIEKLEPLVAALNQEVKLGNKIELDRFLGSDNIFFHEDELFRMAEGLEVFLKDNARSEFFKFEDEIKKKAGENYQRYLEYWRMGTNLLNDFKSFLHLIHSKPNFAFTYVPAFRTLRRFHKRKNVIDKDAEFRQWISPHVIAGFERLEDLVVKDKVLADYFVKYSSPSRFYGDGPIVERIINDDVIFTGEDLYDRIYKLRNSIADSRQLLLDFEKFLGDFFFNGMTISINSLKKDNIEDVFIKIGDSPEFPIQHLGDGIQALIILLFPLFEHKNRNHLIFIEEPELYLHPGFQRAFIEMLGTFKNTQAFIASHSNHILELCQEYSNEISVFKFEKKKSENGEKFYISDFPSVSIEILNALGVRNSSVLLANCTIWVEGISDRLYYRKFLEIFIKENPLGITNILRFKEDIHFAFIEYSGSNIQHWNFAINAEIDRISAQRISNRIFVIHDNDPLKDARYSLLKDQLGENFYKLKCREVENLISPSVLMSVLMSYRKDRNRSSDLKAFEYSDYYMADLGEFLIKDMSSDDFFYFIRKSSSTTTAKIIDKADFATRAVSRINSWGDLTVEARDITIRIFNFITAANA